MLLCRNTNDNVLLFYRISHYLDSNLGEINKDPNGWIKASADLCGSGDWALLQRRRAGHGRGSTSNGGEVDAYPILCKSNVKSGSMSLTVLAQSSLPVLTSGLSIFLGGRTCSSLNDGLLLNIW